MSDDNVLVTIFQRSNNSAVTSTSIPPLAAAQDSMFWLADLLGPVPAGAHLIPCLLAALSLCYRGAEQLAPSAKCARRMTRRHPSQPVIKSPLPMPVYASGRPLVGDIAAAGALRCLEKIASLHGVHVILDVYLPMVERSVCEALATMKSLTKWNVDIEAQLIAAIVFLQQFVTYLPARYLMDHLQVRNLGAFHQFYCLF